MIGTGGIGSGMFFALQGNHTLGREESRAGVFLDRRDYCKLHIISHYVKVLLGPEFNVILAGLVASLSVTSPHTIAQGVERDALREFARRSGISLDAAVMRLLDLQA